MRNKLLQRHTHILRMYVEVPTFICVASSSYFSLWLDSRMKIRFKLHVTKSGVGFNIIDTIRTQRMPWWWYKPVVLYYISVIYHHNQANMHGR